MYGHSYVFLLSVSLQLLPNVEPQFMPAPFPFPGSVGSMPVPAPPMLSPMPMAGPMAGPMPGPIPGPMPFPIMPQQKLPLVVMPYYSKIADKHPRRHKKKKHPRKKKDKVPCSSESSSSSTSSESSDDFDFRANHKSKRKHRRPVLTPVVSYVTKDGYVVYQKKIKKDKAKDWLEMKKPSHIMDRSTEELPNSEPESAEHITELKKKLRFKKTRNKGHSH